MKATKTQIGSSAAIAARTAGFSDLLEEFCDISDRYQDNQSH